jgi:hypothetical protein
LSIFIKTEGERNDFTMRYKNFALVTLNRLSNNSRLKITNRSFHLTSPALWNSLPPDLRHFSSHSTSSQPNLNSPLFSLSPSVFLKRLKTHLFHFSFPPQSHRLDCLWMAISGIDLTLLLHLIVISLSFILMSLTALLCLFLFLFFLTW